MDTVLTVLSLLASGTLVTALVTYAMHRRTTSGSVKSSTAQDLWQEAAGIRKALAEEVQLLRRELDSMRGHLEQKDQEISRLQEKVKFLEERNAELEWELQELRGTPPAEAH